MSNYQRDLERGKQSSEDQLNELRGRVEELDRRSNDLNQQLNEKNSTLSRVEGELEQARSAVRDFEAANNELKSKSESLEKRSVVFLYAISLFMVWYFILCYILDSVKSNEVMTMNSL